MDFRARRSSLLLSLVTAAVASLALAATASAGTVWLCKPGHRPDPCTPGLSTTAYSPRFVKLSVSHPAAVRTPKIDCFYVYPTVSDQKTLNANRHIDPEERSIALYQAARYSQYCRVFAPMYRQLTLAAISHPASLSGPGALIALSDVRAAFRDYLAHDNHGRGFVLIGHSQGSFMLRSLIVKDIDGKPAVRKRLISAILLGGNVLVKRGSGVGGDFKHVPACRSARQLGCVIAFSTFDGPVPTNSLFGRTKTPGDEVLCTNPAALGGGAGILDPIIPSAPFAPGTTIGAATLALGIAYPHPKTVWVSAPGAYRGRCADSGGADVLQITPVRGAPTPKPVPDATWGLHLLDGSIALGNLVSVVRSEASAFAGAHR